MGAWRAYFHPMEFTQLPHECGHPHYDFIGSDPEPMTDERFERILNRGPWILAPRGDKPVAELRAERKAEPETPSTTATKFRAVIAGAGAAGLEAMLALREFAGDRVDITLIADREEWLYRAPSVYEAFGGSGALKVPIAPIAEEAGATVKRGRIAAVLPAENALVLEGGERMPYDAILVAPGASVRPAWDHVTTFDPARADEQLHGLIQDLECGFSHSVAFVAPDPLPWPLPLYELALQTAERCFAMGVEPEISVVTPEQAPLEAFGTEASAAVAQRLSDYGVKVVTGVAAEVGDGNMIDAGAAGTFHAERIVSMPRLSGSRVRGLALDRKGFIRVDRYCRAVGSRNVFAAGDATNVAVRHGSIAAKQGEVAARGIAALAGADVERKPLFAIAYGTLATGRKPLFFKATVVGARGSKSEVYAERPWDTTAKAVLGRLTAHLEIAERSRGADLALHGAAAA
jgi:sulfide:quinone oxidoreductase